MLWKFLIELPLAIGTLFTGGSFWACAKSRAHLSQLLRNPNELKRLFDFFGYDKLVEESATIEPVFGSFASNMVALGKAHFAALNQTRNFMLTVTVVLLALSYLLGIYFLAGNATLFVLLGLGDIPAAAKNNNATHIHELLGNTCKWYQIDPIACREYCTRDSPMLTEIYHLVELNPPAGASSSAT